MSQEPGRDLAAALQAISQFCSEANSLCETLNSLLLQLFPKAGLGLTLETKPILSNQRDDSDWLFVATASSFAVKGRRSAPMYLGYQMSLVGDGASLLGEPVPMLHVCYWDCPIDFREDTYMLLPVVAGYGAKLRKQRLIVWPGEPVGRGKATHPEQWTFSLRLLHLKSSQEVEDLVVRPALALLSGVDVDKALPASPAYIKYPPQVIPEAG